MFHVKHAIYLAATVYCTSENSLAAGNFQGGSGNRLLMIEVLDIEGLAR
ncbi:MAG: hypothetical protein MI725_14585 [Pirellulales bacterium]|nr:hypothetical protein [Pirellulales bacterium]